MKSIKQFLLISVLVACASSASASVISITGPGSVNINDSFQLQILGDFTGEGLIAGGITFNWDQTKVQLDNITLNLPVISDFSCPGSLNCPPNTANSAPIVWGEFLSDLIDPSDPAPTLMATLDFTALMMGGGAAFSMVDNPQLIGGWYGAGFNSINVPQFPDLFTVEIESDMMPPAPMPVPATAWLFLMGLAGVGWTRRKAA